MWQKRVKEVTVDGEREDYFGIKGVPLVKGNNSKCLQGQNDLNVAGTTEFYENTAMPLGAEEG